MNDEKIKVRVTESGQTMEVVVFSKRPDRIEVWKALKRMKSA